MAVKNLLKYAQNGYFLIELNIRIYGIELYELQKRIDFYAVRMQKIIVKVSESNSFYFVSERSSHFFEIFEKANFRIIRFIAQLIQTF